LCTFTGKEFLKTAGNINHVGCSILNETETGDSYVKYSQYSLLVLMQCIYS